MTPFHLMKPQLSTLSSRDDLHKVGQSLSATNKNLRELDGNVVHTQDRLEFVREQQKIMISESGNSQMTMSLTFTTNIEQGTEKESRGL
jgi:hypothetical protein